MFVFSKRRCALITARFSSAKHAPPPCLTFLVERSTLLDQIERQRHKRLLLVHAPAGYGKTVFLSQWHDLVLGSGAVSVWVSLENADGSPEHLLASLASGFAHAGIAFANEPARATDESSASERLELFLSLAESSTRETWLMLDDWHLAETEPTSALIEALLRRMPTNWHVAMTSRRRPAMNLLMLRARGQLIETGLDALRFSADEAERLAEPSRLATGAVDDLIDLTEGWPIALQLAQLWLTDGGSMAALGGSFLGAIEGMAQFVADEVFAWLPPDLKELLLESSICARLNGDLIDFVCERSGSASLIETLRSPHGLIIAIDGDREWYRHHRILAEFLERARRLLPAGRIAHLHNRAARWFERRGLLFEAVEHARLSGDEALTVQLVEDAGCVDICIRTGAPAVRTLLDSLPSDVVRQRPRLRAAYTAMNLKLGSIGQASEILAELQASIGTDSIDAVLRRDLLIVQNLRECFIDESPSVEDLAAQRHSLETFADADWWIKGLMQNVQGRLEMRRGLLHDAVQSLAEAGHVFESGGSEQGHFFMLANLSICHLFLGRLDTAEDYLGQANTVLKRQPSNATGYTGVIQTVEALLLYERNELPAAGHAAQLALAGLELAEGCFEQYFSSIQVAARVAFAASGLDAAARFIDRGRRLARYHGLPRMEGLLDGLELRLTIDAEEWDAAARLAARPGVLPASRETGWLEHDQSMPVLCLLALQEGRPLDARALARAMAERCREARRLPAQVRAHIFEALAGAVLGDGDGTHQALRASIELASSEGVLQPFFEVDRDLLSLLREFQRVEAIHLTSAQADFLSGLILRVIAAGKAKAYIEHLTGREAQILALLRNGGSNKVIARALDLTENAVKFHLKNVFRKLRVDNRAMAAQVARRLDLGAAA